MLFFTPSRLFTITTVQLIERKETSHHLRYVLHKLHVVFEPCHGLRSQNDFQIHAAVSFSPRKGGDFAVKLVRFATTNRDGPSPAEVVVVHGKTWGASHGDHRAVEVPERKQPRRVLPILYAAAHRSVIVRNHVPMQQIRAEMQIARENIPDGCDGWNALNSISEVKRVHLRLQTVAEINRHPKCRRFGRVVEFPRTCHRTPELSR